MTIESNLKDLVDVNLSIAEELKQMNSSLVTIVKGLDVIKSTPKGRKKKVEPIKETVTPPEAPLPDLPPVPLPPVIKDVPPTPTVTPSLTLDQMNTAVMEYFSKLDGDIDENRNEIFNIIKKFGGPKLGEVDPEKFPQILNEIKQFVASRQKA